MLLGGEIYGRLLKTIHNSGKPGDSTAFGSIFMSGPTSPILPIKPKIKPPTTGITHLSPALHVETLNQRRFWEMEEVSAPHSKPPPEPETCETWFLDYVTRYQSGRYSADLPFKSSIRLSRTLNSHQIALRRIYSLERRLDRNDLLTQEYKNYPSLLG